MKMVIAVKNNFKAVMKIQPKKKKTVRYTGIEPVTSAIAV